MFEAVTDGIERPHFVVRPHWQIDHAPIPVHRLAELIIRKDEHGRLGSTILGIGILERGGEDDFAGMGLSVFAKELIAIPGARKEESNSTRRAPAAINFSVNAA